MKFVVLVGRDHNVYGTFDSYYDAEQWAIRNCAISWEVKVIHGTRD